MGINNPSIPKIPPTIQKFLSTGTQTGILFTVTSANATVGATYTNNSHTYTVLSTIAAGTLLFTSGTGTPLSSGTLTKASGTGDATITFSLTQTLGTYTTPTNPSPLYLELEMVGAGSGGGGSSGNSTAGTISSFAFNIANGGQPAGGPGDPPGLGGTAILAPGTIGIALSGAQGPSGSGGGGGSVVGGNGGSSPFGGAGSADSGPGNGLNAVDNTGSGGGGSLAAPGPSRSPNGGAVGGYIQGYITSVSSTYFYCVGGGGTGDTGGAFPGGNGASGLIIVTQYYQ